MNIRSISQPLADIEADWIALGIAEKPAEPPSRVRGTPLGDVIGRLLAAKEIPCGLGETMPLHGVGGMKAGAVLVVGLGPREQFDAGPAFSAGVAIARRLAGKPRKAVAVALPDLGDPNGVASALVEGLIVGTRGPDLRKAEPSRHAFEALWIVGPPGLDLSAPVRRGEVVGRAINLARDLVNTPPSEKSPRTLAARAREVAAEAGIEATVWDEARLSQERFGGVLGVSAGSEQPPAFVILEYRRGGDRPTLALVGKGVTFDSGGLCLKSSSSMEDMKSDMAGAAVVLAAMQAVARLELPVNLAGYLALTENMTGGRAMKMGDVLTMRNKKTVEVLNTDAEGRLILADALSYAVESQPGRVLDLATLTGSCMVALGTKIAGLMGNDEAFSQDVLAACRRTGERAWRLPLDDDFKDDLKSDVADLKNVGGKYGGAITAAKFLEQFVGATPWVHLDIAGPSWNDSDGATADAGGTGRFVRTLIALVESSPSGSPA